MKGLVLAFFIFTQLMCQAQTVGLVMSGGGAAGMAHIGVIKALEENNIPIDYIAGTSAGALVGSFYAIGYSAQEMEALAKDELMLDMSKGYIDKYYDYYFKKRDPNAKIVEFGFNRDFKFTKVLPVNFTDPALTDFYFLETFTIPSMVANHNLDSLFIPLRTVASDIDMNESYVFRKGYLSQAVRTSMSFPFYLPGIVVDDKLLLDGGLYNNFPADVMYDDFLPDIMIGSSVSSPRDKPDPDDITTQVLSMLQAKSSFDMHCQNGLLIEPQIRDIGTFDFEKRALAIERGYQEGLRYVDTIKKLLEGRSVDSTALAKKRIDYRKKVQGEILIDQIEVSGVNKYEERYIRSLLKDKNETIELENIKRRYFKLIQDDKIKFIFPLLIKNKNNDNYTLKIRVRKNPEFNFRIGGNFSSRAVNTGYLGLDYRFITSYFAMTPSVNSYFGRFYSSLDLSLRTDFPLDVPFYVEPFATYNRWDYFRSFSSFFEDTKPAFLIKNEAFFGGTIGFPVTESSRIKLTGKNGLIGNEYYQTDQFLSTDTTDRNEFYFTNLLAEFEYNSLDGFYLSKSGRQIRFSGGYIFGSERNFPGSTSSLANTDTVTQVDHQYILLKGRYEEYFDLGLNYKLGFEVEGVYSTQDFFENYTASILVTPQYMPTQEHKTKFTDAYTANQYISGGIKNVFPINSVLDLRIEGYYFQPFQNIMRNADNKAEYSPVNLTSSYYTLSSALVINSPIGPTTFRANYWNHRKEKFSFMINLNYTIFNRKALTW